MKDGDFEVYIGEYSCFECGEDLDLTLRPTSFKGVESFLVRIVKW